MKTTRDVKGVGLVDSAAGRRPRRSPGRCSTWPTSSRRACCTPSCCAARTPTRASSRSTPAGPGRCPGVRAVLTAADIPELKRRRPTRAHAVLAIDRVVFVGQPVAAVAADEPAIAEEALDLIKVEYEVLPAAIDPLQSMQPGAPPVADAGTEADTSEALAHSAVAHRQERDAAGEGGQHLAAGARCSAATWPRGSRSPTSSSRRPTACRWSTRATSSRTPCWPSGTRTGLLTLWASTQGSFNTRSEVADVLGIPENPIRVIPVECGGGFGGKIRALCEPITAVLAQRHQAGPCAT